MKKLENIFKSKLSEMFNPNDLAYQSSDFVKKLSSVRSVDNVTDEIPDSELDVILQLKNAIHENDDEVHLEFDDGNNIKLDINIVKYMFANFSDEQIINGLESFEALSEMMDELFDVIYLDDEVEDELEDTFGEDESDAN